MKVTAYIPGFVPSGANMREHWRARAKRVSGQRFAARCAVGTVAPVNAKIPTWITFTRISPRPLDTDNLAYACKAYRDGVADVFGVPDNHPGFDWRYAQAKDGKAKGLRIELEW